MTVLLAVLLPGQALLHAQAAAPEAQARRYHEMLLRRPQSGAVFDRFHAEWLKSGTTDSLQAYLELRCAATTATAADHLLLGVFYERQGNDASAVKAFATSLEKDATNAVAWLGRAKIEVRLLDFATALKSLDKASGLQPADDLKVDIAKLRGRVLVRQSQPQEALKVWRTLLTAHPEDRDLAEDVIDLLVESTQIGEAISLAEQLVTGSRDVTEKMTRRLQLGDLQQRAGQKDNALATLGQCLTDAGQDTWIEGDVLQRIESVFRREDDVNGLEAHLKKLETANPTRMALPQARARVLVDLGKPDEAIKLYEGVLERTPGKREVRETFLSLLETAGKIPEAIAQTKQLIAQHPGDRELWAALAGLHQQAKEPVEAKAALDAYLALPGAGEPECLRVARTLDQWDRKEEARAAFNALVKAYPDSATARETQAHFLHRTGEREAAITAWTAMASKGGKEDVLRVAQAMSAHLEAKPALDLLAAHEKNFADDSRYLAQLVTAAITAKDHARAEPWVRRRLELARDAGELDESVKQALTVLKGAGRAGALLDEMKAKPPASFPARCLYAELLEEGRAPELAEAALKAETTACPALVQGRLVRLYERRNDWQKAGDAMEALFAMPDQRLAMNAERLAEIRQRSGHLEAALNWIAEWKKLSPSAVKPWLTEARVLELMGRQDAAIQVLRTAVARHEDSPDVVQALVAALMQAGKVADAERVCVDQYEKEQDLQAKMRWVQQAAEAAQTGGGGGVPRLVEKFKERQRTNRQSPVLWLALAQIHRVGGNEEQRVEALGEASKLRSQDLDLMSEVARGQEELGRWQEATRTLEKALALDKTTRTRERIARLHLEYGDEDVGHRMLFELAGAERMDPRNAESLAMTLAARMEWKRAVDILEPLLLTQPKDYRLHYLHAVCLEEDGRGQDAAVAFARVASMLEELPKPPGTGQGALFSPFPQFGLQGLDEDDYPPSVRDLLKLNIYAQSAYAYRNGANSQNFYAYGLGGGMPSTPPSFISLPSRVEEAAPLALLHLRELGRNGDALTRTRTEKLLRQAGIDKPDLLLGLEESGRGGGLLIPDELLEKNPQDLALHAWWLFQSRNRWTATDAPVFKRCMEILGTQYPLLALQAAISGASLESPLRAEFKREALARLKASPKQGVLLLGMMQSVIGQSATWDDRKEWHDAIIPLATQARATLPQAAAATANPYGISMYGADPRTQATAILLHLLLATERFEELVTLLDEECSQPIPQAQANVAQQMFFFSSYGPPLLEAVRFPNGLLRWPQIVVQQLGLAGQYFNLYIGGNPAAKGPDLSKLPAAAEKAKNPYLRLMLMRMASKLDVVQASIEARLKAPDATAVDWVLAAWVADGNEAYAPENLPATRTGDAGVVAGRLAHATGMPMDPSVRITVDSSLVEAVMRIEKDARPAPLVAAAQEAARRLRSGSLQAQQVQELVAAMEDLGLAADAAALTQTGSNPSAFPAGRFPGMRGIAFSRPNTSPNAFENHLKAGRKEAAVREALRQYRALAPQLYQQSGSYILNQAEQITKKLSSAGLRDAALAQIGPLDGATPQQMAAAGALLELMKEQEKARSLYETALKRMPRLDQARLRLIEMLVPQDPAAAAAHLAELQPSGLQLVLNQMSNFVYSNNYAGNDEASKRRTQTLAVLTHWFKAMAESGKPLESTTVDFVTNVLGGSQELPDEFCRLFLQFPETAEMGLAMAASDALTEEWRREDSATPANPSGPADKPKPASIKELAGMARSLLESASDPRKKNRILDGMANRSSFFSRGRGGYLTDNPRGLPPRPTVPVLLLWDAWKRNQPGEVDAVIRPLASQVLGEKQLEALSLAARLFFCPEAEFEKCARDFCEAPEASMLLMGYANSPFQERGPEQFVIDVWGRRKLQAPLDAFLLERVKVSKTMAGLLRPVSWYMMQHKMGKPEEVTAFIHRVRETLLGTDVEARKRSITKYQEQRYGGGRRIRFYQPDPPVNTYCQWIDDISRVPKLFPFVIATASEDGFTDEPNWMRNLLGNLTRNDDKMTAADWYDSLQGTFMLEDAPKFRAWLLDDRGNQTLLGRYISTLREGRTAEVKALLQARLVGTQPRTFGTDLVLALLKSDTSSSSNALPVLDFVKAHHDDFARLPAGQSSEVLALLRNYLPDLSRPVSLAPETREILAPLLEANGRDLESMASEILAKPWKQLSRRINGDEYAYRDLSGRIFQRLASTDPARALAFAEKSLALIKGFPSNAGQAANARRKSDTPGGRWLSDAVSTPESYRILLPLLDAEGMTRDADWLYNNVSSSVISRTFKEADGPVRVFECLGLLGEAQDFRADRLQQNRMDSLLDYAVTILDWTQYKAKRQPLIHTLEQRTPRTFGTDLVLALLRPEPQEPLREFMKKRAGEFARVQPAHAGALLATLRNRLPELQAGAPPADLLAAMAPLLEMEGVEAREQQAKIMTAQSWIDLNMTASEFWRTTSVVLRNLSSTDLPEAIKVFHQARSLIKSGMAISSSRSTVSKSDYDAWMRTCAAFPRLVPTLIEAAAADGATSNGWLIGATADLTRDEVMRNHGYVISLFESLPFLKPAAEFRPIKLPGGDTETLLARVVDRLGSDRLSPSRAALLERLNAGTKTFGGAFVVAMLRRDRAAALAEMLVAREAEITSLHESGRAEIGIILRKELPGLGKPGKLSPALSRALAPILGDMKSQDDRWLEEIFAAQRVEDLSLSQGDFRTEAPRLLKDLADKDEVKARALLTKAATLLAGSEWQTKSEEYLTYQPLPHLLLAAAMRPQFYDEIDRLAQRHEYDRHEAWADALANALLSPEALSDHLRVLGFLKNSPLGADAERFEPVFLKRRQTSLMELLAVKLRQSQLRVVGDAVRASLNDMEPRTFGASLLLALLEDDPVAAVAQFIKENEAAIAKLSGKGKLHTALLLRPHLSRIAVLDAPLAKDLHVKLGPILAEETAHQKQLFTAISGARRFSELGIEQSSWFHRHVTSLLEWMMADGAGDPKATLARACTLYKEAQGSSSDTSATSASRPTAVFLQRVADSPQLVPLVLELAREEKLDDLAPWRHQIVGSTMHLDAPTRGPADTLAVLEVFGLLRDAASYQDYLAPGQAYRSLLGYLDIWRRSSSTRSHVPGLLALVQERKPDTFGTELVEALLDPAPEKAIPEFRKIHGTALASLKPEFRDAANHALDTVLRSVPKPNAASPPDKVVVKPNPNAAAETAEQFRDRVLKASHVADLNLHDNEFDKRAQATLAHLMVKDRAAATDFFNRCCALMEKRQKETPWPKSDVGNGWSFRSNFLQRFAESNASLAGMAFAIELCQLDESGELSHSGWSTQYGWAALLEREWKQRAGELDPGAAVTSLLADLAPVLGRAPPALFAIPFHGFMERLDRRDRNALTARAAPAQGDDATMRLAREFAMATKLYLLGNAKATGIEPQPGAVQALPELEQVWEHYRKVMADGSLNPRVRVALGTHLCHHFPRIVPADIVLRAAELSAAEQAALHSHHGYMLGSILRRFVELPADDNWNRIADAQWAAWVLRNEKLPGRDYDATRKGLAYSPHAEPVCAMLEMVAHQGKKDRIHHMLATQSDYLDEDLLTVPLLAIHGRHAEAANFLSSHRAELWTFMKPVREYGPRVAAAIPGLTAACDDPDLKLISEMSLLLLPDPPVSVYKAMPGFKTKGLRCRAFIEKLQKSTIVDPAAQEFIVGFMLPEAPTLLPLYEKELAVIHARTDWSVLATLNYVESRKRRAQCPAAYLALEASRGNVKPAMDAVNALLSATSRHSHTPRYMYREVMMAFATYTRGLWRIGQGRERAELPLLLQHVLSLPLDTADNHWGELLSLWLVQSAATGNNSCREWRDGTLMADRSDPLRKWFGYTHPVWPCAAAYAGDGKAVLPLEPRLRMCLELLKDTWVQNTTPAGNVMLPMVRDHHVLNREEALKNADALIAAWPREGRSASELAILAEEAGDMPLAASLLERAARQAANHPDRRAEFLLQKAVVQFRAGAKDSSIKTLQEMSTERLDETLVRQREAMLKVLQK